MPNNASVPRHYLLEVCVSAWARRFSVLDDNLRERANGSCERIAAKGIIASLDDEACMQLGSCADVAQDVLQATRFFDKGSCDMDEVSHVLTRFNRCNNNFINKKLQLLVDKKPSRLTAHKKYFCQDYRKCNCLLVSLHLQLQHSNRVTVNLSNRVT